MKGSFQSTKIYGNEMIHFDFKFRALITGAAPEAAWVYKYILHRQYNFNLRNYHCLAAKNIFQRGNIFLGRCRSS